MKCFTLPDLNRILYKSLISTMVIKGIVNLKMKRLKNRLKEKD